MADITYTVNQDDPNSIQGFEQFSQADKNLIGTFEVNNLFDSSKNLAEVHILSLSDEVLESDYNYSNYKLLGNAQSAGKSGASILSIDPIEDSKLYGYQYGGVKLLYHFLNDLYTKTKERVPFYIESISPDRTELRLQSLDLSSDDIKSYTQAIKDKLLNQSYFNEFRLNFDNNDLFIGINIDVVESEGSSYVAVKLYEPLPANYDLKSTTYINEVISNSVAYEVDSLSIPEVNTAQSLRSPNFNLEILDYSTVPTGYYSYDELFSYPVNNTNSQIFSLYNEKGAEISIDHTDYANFIHFSSAYERLVNFKYKIQLIENYSSSLGEISTATSQSAGITGSTTYFTNLIEGIISNFDHYERFLYYESSSYAWPKSNTVEPYINVKSTNTTTTTWYANQLATANGYDLTNGSILVNSIPTYLRDDPNNENYLTFIYMIGQHFDNLWLYGKAVTDKYNADNRLDFGISKDLVGEALKNFGIKLYTSNNSIEDLFGSFIGQAYQSGSEDINYYITGSLTGSNIPIQPSSYDNYNKEVQKRIYHNLSHLVKTKGTERGLRALINCFGIPSDILKIKLYGGRNVDERPFYGDFQYYSSSLDKIRLDHTGSLITGSTLSSYTSIYKRDPKYTDDLHAIEVGFSPTDNIDNYIVSYSLATSSLSTFNIDDYIGDPRSLTANTYGLLNTSGSVIYSLSDLTDRIMSSSTAYDVFDYVRLIKFFDNTIFKMVRDFIPARVTADTGIIIKPHLLQRNKAKSVILSGSRPELSASIDTAFIESSDGETFGRLNNYITSYVEGIQSPSGITPYLGNSQEQPRYNGELDNSELRLTDGELNIDNGYKDLTGTLYTFTNNILFVSGTNEVCSLGNRQSSPLIITSSTFDLTANYLFSNVREATVYSTSSRTLATGPTLPGNPYSPVTFPFNLTGYTNYSQFYISASSVDIVGPTPCTSSILVRFATCSIAVSTLGSNQVNVLSGTSVDPTDLTAWFTYLGIQTQVQYTASWYDGVTNNDVGITDPTSYYFMQDGGTPVTIRLRDPYSDNCQASVTVVVGICQFSTMSTGSAERGLEFEFSEYGKICFPDKTMDPGSDPEVLEYYNFYYSSNQINPTVFNILDGTLFNTYGVPVDPCIGFRPKFLQRPRSTPITEYGTTDPFYVQPGKDRGIQSFIRPYTPLPAQGLEIPPNIAITIYEIRNAPLINQDPGADTQYYHTVANPSGSDEYIANLFYSEVSPQLEGQTINYLTTALGGGINLPTPNDITTTAAHMKPITFVAPPKNYLDPIDGGPNQTVKDYRGDSLFNKAFARIGDGFGRGGLPVAFHLVISTPTGGGGVACTKSITIYPSEYTRILCPPISAGPGFAPTWFGNSNWNPGSTTQKYIFVNKTVNINTDPAVFGVAPVGDQPPLTVPIRKRALI